MNQPNDLVSRRRFLDKVVVAGLGISTPWYLDAAGHLFDRDPYKGLRSRKYLWHAGIFLAEVRTILTALERYHAPLYRGLERMRIRGGTLKPAQAFRRLPRISFDYAVLERLKDASVIRCRFGWNDVGTWQSLSDLWRKDRFGNATFGKMQALRSRGSLVYAQGKEVCLNDVRDLVVIDTPEVLFVSRKSGAESFRRVVARLSRDQS